MSNGRELDRPLTFEIRISGRLDSQWSDWFDKLTITQAGDQTLLRGTVADQAALYGILLKLHNLGLPLLSFHRIHRYEPQGKPWIRYRGKPRGL